MKKKQEPTKSKQSPHGAHRPQTSLDKLESLEEREAETRVRPAAMECDSEELPDSDEETKVVLLPVNPYLVHVYWGIAAYDQEELGTVLRRPGTQAQPVLRFYDVTPVNSGSTNTPSCFEVEIDLRAKNWYVHLKSPAKSYCIDLGVRTEGGGFHRLARSNVAETPPARPSDKVEESFLLVEWDYPRADTLIPPLQSAEVIETLLKPSPIGVPRGGEGKAPESRGISRSAPTYGSLQDAETKGLGAKEQRFSRSVSPGEIERKIAEFYQRRSWEWPTLAPNAGGTGESQPSGKERVDLTDLSERRFRAGLSSGQKSSK